MAEENFQISAEMEGELKPRIYIIANDLAKFQPVAEHLIKNGFPAQVQVGPPTERPAAGSIFFISFNLKSFDAVTLARNLERKFELFCVVFAEEIGTQTATKLSSAKMTQTLQHPYTEKNFLMAVQTVVRKRRAQFEKDWRKKQHEARLNARRTPSSERAETSVDLVVSKDEESLGSENLILQKAAPRMIDDSAKVFKGEEATGFVATQEAPKTKSFFTIQEGASPKPGSRNPVAVAKIETSRSRETRAPLSVAASESEIPALLQGSRGEGAVVTTPPAKSFRDLVSEIVSDDRSPSVAWTIVVMCLLGSSICLYCVYQILFT